MSNIKVIIEPSIRLVGRQTIDEDALAAFLSDEGAETWTTDTEIGSQKLIEVAGRTCYSSWLKPRPGGNAAYLNHILEVGHGSVVEHSCWNFIITGVSRSFTHELCRHRAGWAYSQRSQRFCDESGGSFVVPPLIEKYRREVGNQVDIRTWKTTDDIHELDAEIAAVWERSIGDAVRSYGVLSDLLQKRIAADPEYWKLDATLRRKQAREAARSVLPNATATEIFVTANGRALRHFIEARGDEHADAEIRRVALAMLAIMQAEAGNLFGDYTTEDRPGIGPVIATPYRKV